MLLTKTYKNISDLEEEKVRRNKHLQLSISELHLMEAVGKYSGTGGATITELANDLGFTLPAVTIAIGGLEKKGYVRRESVEYDARLKKVILTEQGIESHEKIEAIIGCLNHRMIQGIEDDDLQVFLRVADQIRRNVEKEKL